MASEAGVAMAKEESAREPESAQEKIVAAIRRAGAELGRAPSRGELRRITGLSHYKVLAEFASLREAVRAAGLEPNKKGERIETEALLEDWKRVGEKLGRSPSRAEYVREGKYSAGAFVARFGAWSNVESGNRDIGKSGHRKAAGCKRSSQGISREASSQKTSRKTRIRKKVQEHESNGDKAMAFQWGERLAPLLPPLVGKRRVTEMVAALVVEILLGANGIWQLANGQNQELNHKGHEGSQRENEYPLVPRGIDKDRAVMGPPLEWLPMTNAPLNELGVVFLFGMVAAGLGFQVESLQGKFPDCEAKREVVKGKWQRSRIEFEYESKNFHLHGHDPKGCDVIVCWRHNWKGCPEELEVIELRRIIGRSGHREIG
jgi:hypothetical protein